jgi:nitroreductase
MPEPGQPSVLSLLNDNGCVTRFKPDPLPPDLLETVLKAACQTPSPWNLQTWQFVVVRSLSARKLVLEQCGGAGPAAKAPVLLIALGDPAAWKRAPERLAEMVRSGTLKEGEEAGHLERIRRLWSAPGAAQILAVARTHAALQQLSLAAGAFNLGTAWIVEYDDAKLMRAFHIPENLVIVAVVGLGYCEERRSLPAPVLGRMVFAEAYGLPWSGNGEGDKSGGEA